MIHTADNPDPGSGGRLGLAGILSIALHVGLGVALLGSPSILGAPAPLADSLDAEAERPQTRPGIQASRQVTINWLGFAQPTEHAARPAEVEQAALTPTPGVRAAEPLPQSPAEPKAVQTAAAPEEAARPLVSEIPLPPILAVETPDDAPAVSKPATAPVTPLPEARTEESPAEAATGSSGEQGQPGIESPKESDATSVNTPVEWTPGRPPAVEGLDITTVRPEWTLTTRFTALPRNPVVRIQFGKDGKVRKAEFVPGQSTGYKDVDGPLLDALYRWRASGKALEALGDNPAETVSMDFLIILKPTRGPIRKPTSDR